MKQISLYIQFSMYGNKLLYKQFNQQIRERILPFLCLPRNLHPVRNPGKAPNSLFGKEKDVPSQTVTS